MAPWPAYRLSLVLACLLAFVSVASARDDGARRAAALHWVRLPGAEDCSGGDALSRAVEARLRREVFPAPRNATLLIEGYVERVSSGYRAQLQMRSSDGTLLGSRELSSEASDCGELSETIAVVLAVMIDPDAAGQGEPSEPPPEPPGQENAAAPDADKYAQRVEGFARLAFGLYRAAALGLGAAYELALGGWGGLRAEAVLFAPSRATESDAPAQMSAYLGFGGLGYCPLWFTIGRLRSAACASGEVGAIYVQRTDFSGARPKRALWLSASLSARFALRLIGPLELHVGGAASFPRRYEFDDDRNRNTPAPYQLSKVQGTLDVGLGARF